MAFFGFGKKEKDKMKTGLEKTRTGFWGSIMNTLTGSVIDDEMYDDLEEKLILADVGGSGFRRVQKTRYGFIIVVYQSPLAKPCSGTECAVRAEGSSKEKMIMKEFQYTVKDACGIHARPAGLLVKTVKGFASTATLEKDGKSCDMRKLMALMGMGVKQGETVTIKVEGDDEEAAAEAIQKFLSENV